MVQYSPLPNIKLLQRNKARSKQLEKERKAAMTPSPPTMAEQSAEVVVREWSFSDSANVPGRTKLWADGKRIGLKSACIEHNALRRAYLALQSELRAALAREAEWRGHAGWWMNKANELNATAQNFEKMANELTTGNKAAEMGKALEDIAGGMIPSPILDPALAAFEATGDKLPFKEMMIEWLQGRARAALKPGSET